MNFFNDNILLSNLTEMYPQMAEWEQAADPTVRFKNNYYTLQRLAFLKDYNEAMQTAIEPEDQMSAQIDLDEQLAALRKRYIADLKLLIELNLTMCNIFLPHKIHLNL